MPEQGDGALLELLEELMINGQSPWELEDSLGGLGYEWMLMRPDPSMLHAQSHILKNSRSRNEDRHAENAPYISIDEQV